MEGKSLAIEQVQLTVTPHKSKSVALTICAASTLILVAAVIGGVVGALIQGSVSSKNCEMPAMYDASAGADMEPSQVAPLESYSSTHMKRAGCSFSGTARANYSLCLGINTILDANSGAELFQVRTEVVTDAPFGEFASGGSPSVIDRRSFRLVVSDSLTGSRLVIVPFGMSEGALLANRTVSLQPNLFFIQYLPGPPSRRKLSWAAAGGSTADQEPFGTFASSLPGGLVASNIPKSDWLNKTMATTLWNYWAAAKKDGTAAGKYGSKQTYGKASWGNKASWTDKASWPDKTRRRELGFWGDVGEDVGQWAGNKVGSDAGTDVGRAVGSDVGEWAGGAIGGAIGGPVGADLGGMVGREVGSWAGAKIGGHEGGDLGGDAGGWLGGLF